HEASKVHMTDKYFNMFLHRIRVLARLFTLEQKSEHLEAGFRAAEQGTARAFLEALGKTRANLLASVSPKLQANEQKLLRDIRLPDLRIDKESARPLDKRDSNLVGQLIKERNDAEAKLKQLIAQLEKENPQYAALKYPRPCTLEQARECLAPNEVALL